MVPVLKVLCVGVDMALLMWVWDWVGFVLRVCIFDGWSLGFRVVVLVECGCGLGLFF